VRGSVIVVVIIVRGLTSIIAHQGFRRWFPLIIIRYDIIVIVIRVIVTCNIA
jgi:ABC-type phosphate transport system auxiliary subunit